MTFGIDPSLAATYNAKHDTKYAVLDESYYEFPERTATVEAGKSVSEPLTIHFKNLDQLDIDATQLLPVTIVSAGGGLSTLSGSQTVYYLVRRSSAITTAAVLTDNWIDVPAFDKAGTADCVNGLTAVTYEAIVRVHDFHYAGPTSSYIEEKLSTIMGVEQHLPYRINPWPCGRSTTCGTPLPRATRPSTKNWGYDGLSEAYQFFIGRPTTTIGL